MSSVSDVPMSIALARSMRSRHNRSSRLTLCPNMSPVRDVTGYESLTFHAVQGDVDNLGKDEIYEMSTERCLVCKEISHFF